MLASGFWAFSVSPSAFGRLVEAVATRKQTQVRVLATRGKSMVGDPWEEHALPTGDEGLRRAGTPPVYVVLRVLPQDHTAGSSQVTARRPYPAYPSPRPRPRPRPAYPILSFSCRCLRSLVFVSRCVCVRLSLCMCVCVSVTLTGL